MTEQENGPSAAAQSGKGRLSATGHVRRWLVGSPRLAADVTSVTGETRERPNVFAILARLLLLVAVMLSVVGAACWLLFGMTIMPTVRADGQNWLVRVGAWTQGEAPTGTPAFVLPQKVERDAGSRAVLLISPSGNNTVVTVLAGPGQAVKAAAGKTVIVEGRDTGVPVSAGYKFVNDGGSYLAVCQAGPCGIRGHLVTVPVDQVLGEIVGGIGFGGLTPPPTLTAANDS